MLIVFISASLEFHYTPTRYVIIPLLLPANDSRLSTPYLK